MARIKDFLLTPEITDELVASFEEAPDIVLETWGKEALKGGYTRAAAIRNRLLNMARNPARLEPWVEAMLAEHLPYRSTIRLFDPAFIRRSLPLLESTMGRGLLLLCLLLDERPEVYQLGVEEAGRPAGEVMDYETARGRLEDLLAPALLPFAPEDLDEEEDLDTPPLGEGKPIFAAEPGPAAEPLNVSEFRLLLEDADARIKELREELETKKERNRRNMEQLVQANRRKLHQLQQQKDQLTQQVLRLTNDKTALEKQLHDIRNTQAQAIKEGVRQKTDLLLHRWLEPPVRTEEVVEQTSGTTPDLLARAEAGLKAQAQQDRHTGNRLELTARLTKLQELHRQLAAALQSAIRPLPENAKIVRELEEEIARMRGVLGQAEPEPTLGRLQERIALAADPEQLESCGQLLDALERHELFPPAEVRKLYAAIQSRLSLVTDKAAPRATVSTRPSGWLLRDVLYRNQESLLLVDGYNCLFMLPDIFGPDFDHGSPGPRARARLIDGLKTLVLPRNKVQTRVYFDGPSARTDHIAPQLQVEFTGGVGDHRADQQILASVSPKGLADLGQKRFVVTDDRNLRREAEARGAIAVPVNLFAVLLHDFKAL